jgi:hypothetical protein
MKILHIGSTAGIAAILSKYQYSKVLCRKKLDPFKISEFYNCKYPIFDTAYFFGLQALSRAPFYDILHIHSCFNVFKKLIKLFKKKIVFHSHGTEARRRFKKLNKFKCVKLVATKDLLDIIKDSFYIPNPVDTDLFRDLGFSRFDKALLPVKQNRKHMYKYLLPIANELAREIGVELVVWFVDEQPVQYKLLSGFLNCYKYFLDFNHGYIKKDKDIPSHSALGLQAMACGCTVYSTFDKPRNSLIEEHKPNNVLAKIKQVYSN